MWTSALLVTGAGLCAWWGVWRAGFLFDDLPAIVDNPALQAGDWWTAAFGEPHQPLANRPLTCLSFTLDFLVYGKGPAGVHTTSLLLHLGNALLLFATLRRVLLAQNLGGRFGVAAARWLATAVACVWVAHPLAADAVAYATQRSTLLAGGFLLLALFAATHEHDTKRPWPWRALVLVAMAGGMASKEDFVVAPLLYVLFERAFLVPSWAAMRARWRWYAVLASSWSLLAFEVALGPANPTVGYHTTPPITAWQWAMTQASALVHYIRLVVWPHPQRGAYGTAIVDDLAVAVLPGLCVLALIVVVIACWPRRPWWGWLGALFFLCLAPTSSILPMQSEVLAERRVYLPMLFVLVPVVLLGNRLLDRMRAAAWLRAALCAAVVAVLAVRSQERVAVYSDDLAFWTDAYQKRDIASRSSGEGLILSNYAAQLWQLGRQDEALACIEESVGCVVTTAIALKQAVALQQRGKVGEAVALLRRLRQEDPDDADVLGTLGTCLVGVMIGERSGPEDPRLAEAERALEASLAAQPRRAEYWNSLGYVLRVQGRLDAAERAYFRATELTHQHLQPYQLRGELLLQLGRRAELAPMFEGLLARRPGEVALRLQVGELLLRWREFALATVVVQDALRIEPHNEQARALLQRVPAVGR